MFEKGEDQYRIEFIAMHKALSRALRVHAPTTITQVLASMAMQTPDGDNMKLKKVAEIVSEAFNTTPASMFNVAMNSETDAYEARIAFLFVVSEYTMEDIGVAKSLFIGISVRTYYRWIKAANERMYGAGAHTHQGFHKRIERCKNEIDKIKQIRRPDR